MRGDCNMSLYKEFDTKKDPSSKTFAESFCSNANIQELAKKLNIKFLPFDCDREFKDIQLLYPAWTARELAVTSNTRGALSKLWTYGKHPENFITCLKGGEIVFILGFTPVEGKDILELSLLSGKPLKRIFSHKFADVFSLFLSLLQKSYLGYFIIATCLAEAPVYGKFAEHFSFKFWEKFTAYGHQYMLYIFKPV